MLCFWTGVSLVIVAALMLMWWQWNIRTSQKRIDTYVQTIRTAMPEPQGAALEERSDNTMAVLSLDGPDFIGLLELPRYGSTLPVCAQWGAVSKYPCCFDGSAYDRTLQIGATSQKGQYDFYRELSVGDSLFFTDMEGNRYAYTVTALHYVKHADRTALHQEDADLTLFIKNVYALEYLIVSCNTG